MNKYFVSIREGSKNGPTVWGNHIEAQSLRLAKENAEKQFTDFKPCPSSDASVIKFYAAIEETRVRCITNGYTVMGHRSNAKG